MPRAQKEATSQPQATSKKQPAKAADLEENAQEEKQLGGSDEKPLRIPKKDATPSGQTNKEEPTGGKADSGAAAAAGKVRNKEKQPDQPLRTTPVSASQQPTEEARSAPDVPRPPYIWNMWWHRSAFLSTCIWENQTISRNWLMCRSMLTRRVLRSTASRMSLCHPISGPKIIPRTRSHRRRSPQMLLPALHQKQHFQQTTPPRRSLQQRRRMTPARHAPLQPLFISAICQCLAE